MTKKLAVEISDKLAALNYAVAIAGRPQEAGPSDWDVGMPVQDMDLTDISEEMRKLGVRVKISGGNVVFFPPKDDLPENVASEEEEVWAERTSCKDRFGHPCPKLPCPACGNGNNPFEWIDESSIGPMTQLDPRKFRLGNPFAAG